MSPLTAIEWEVPATLPYSMEFRAPESVQYDTVQVAVTSVENDTANPEPVTDPTETFEMAGILVNVTVAVATFPTWSVTLASKTLSPSARARNLDQFPFAEGMDCHATVNDAIPPASATDPVSAMPVPWTDSPSACEETDTVGAAVSRTTDVDA